MHWALRFINCCGLLASGDEITSSARAICLGFELAPPAKKPGKRASEGEGAAYAVAQKECAISKRGALVVANLRHRLDGVLELKDKKLVMSVDGGFTNKSVFTDMPERTVLVGRIRKDACLYDLPPVVIEPLAYRRTKKAKLLYKDPAYLVASDPHYDSAKALQCYFHRSQIEVSHRDAKSLIGAGDAQVRNSVSVGRVPQFAMAVYSLLLLASEQAYGVKRTDDYGMRAKWRNDTRQRTSTNEIIRLFRHQCQQAGTQSFYGFGFPDCGQRTHKNVAQTGIHIATADTWPLPRQHEPNQLRC